MVDQKPIEQWIRETGSRLKAVGIEEPRKEARWIIAEALAISLTEQYKDSSRTLTLEEQNHLDEIVLRRLNHEPLSSIFRKSEFFGHSFRLNETCLAPRPETELLVEIALNVIGERAEFHLKLAELCCGSGAPGLSLLHAVREQGMSAKLLLLDIEQRTVAMARENAIDMQLSGYCEFLVGDLFPPLTGDYEFDIILVNPPYIETGQLTSLMPEVRKFDPSLALDGGEDGLDFYRRLAQEIHRYLAPNAWLVLEHGAGQRERILELFAPEREVLKIEIFNDYAGHDRAIAVNYR